MPAVRTTTPAIEAARRAAQALREKSRNGGINTTEVVRMYELERWVEAREKELVSRAVESDEVTA